MECSWCKDPNTDYYSDDLCEIHEAEFLGISSGALERSQVIAYQEYMDTLN